MDEAEQLAIDRAKQLFGAEHANVQPHSGSGANMAVYFAMLKPGDKLLTMDLSHGGHLTHGNKANFSGKFFEIVHYGVRPDDGRIDYDQLAVQAREHRPKMITVGASAYSRIIDFKRMSEIAQEVGALLLADIAHIAGLVAAGIHPSPVPFADFVTTTTHKTLRGPRGGLILCKAQYAKAIDSQVFPGIQGGPLMHVIAAKAVCFLEALQPSFADYQRQIVKNSVALAAGMTRNGFRLISGGTENHLMLVDVGGPGPDRQAVPARARRGRHHDEQEHHSVRDPLALRSVGHPPGHPGGHHPGNEGGGDVGHRGHDQRGTARHRQSGHRPQGTGTGACPDGAVPIAGLRHRAPGVDPAGHRDPTGAEAGAVVGRRARRPDCQPPTANRPRPARRSAPQGSTPRPAACRPLRGAAIPSFVHGFDA